MKGIEKLQIEEARVVADQVETLLKNWRKLKEDYKDLEAKFNLAQEEKNRWEAEKNKDIAIVEDKWQRKYEDNSAALLAEKNQMESKFNQQLAETVKEYEERIEKLCQEIEKERQLKETLMARVRGDNV